MPEYEKSADECSHENLYYHGVDVCEPRVMYEDWHCEDCGAAVVTVYEPQRRIIDPIDGDAPTEEVDV